MGQSNSVGMVQSYNGGAGTPAGTGGSSGTAGMPSQGTQSQFPGGATGPHTGTGGVGKGAGKGKKYDDATWSTMTIEQRRATMGCKDFALGTCTRANCSYSHDPEKVPGTLKKIEGERSKGQGKGVLPNTQPVTTPTMPGTGSTTATVNAPWGSPALADPWQKALNTRPQEQGAKICFAFWSGRCLTVPCAKGFTHIGWNKATPADHYAYYKAYLKTPPAEIPKEIVDALEHSKAANGTPSMKVPTFCPAFMQGNCTLGSSCPFPHPDQVPAVPAVPSLTLLVPGTATMGTGSSASSVGSSAGSTVG